MFSFDALWGKNKGASLWLRSHRVQLLLGPWFDCDSNFSYSVCLFTEQNKCYITYLIRVTWSTNVRVREGLSQQIDERNRKKKPGYLLILKCFFALCVVRKDEKKKACDVSLYSLCTVFSLSCGSSATLQNFCVAFLTCSAVIMKMQPESYSVVSVNLLLMYLSRSYIAHLVNMNSVFTSCFCLFVFFFAGWVYIYLLFWLQAVRWQCIMFPFPLLLYCCEIKKIIICSFVDGQCRPIL